jgi:transposase
MTMALADLGVNHDVAVAPRIDQPKRRQFTADYKQRILAEYDAAPHGRRGEILRRERLFSSHIIDWRRQAAAGAKSKAAVDRRDKENAALLARAEKAERELAKANAALEIVGKAHALLELLSESAETEKRSKR